MKEYISVIYGNDHRPIKTLVIRSLLIMIIITIIIKIVINITKGTTNII